MSAPQWSPVDGDTADLLTLFADDVHDPAEYEWNLYIDSLFRATAEDNTIDPNRLREVIGGRIKPQRVGAFTHRALRSRFVEYSGEYVISTDTRGRNSGKPCRQLRWCD